MEQKDIVQVIRDLLDDPKSDSLLEKFSEEFEKQIFTDSESPRKKAFKLLLAFLEDPQAADNVFIALSGWNMRSLLILAGLIPDNEGLLLK